MSGGDGFDELALAAGPGDHSASDQILLDGSLIAGLGVVVVELPGEFVGVVEDL